MGLVQLIFVFLRSVLRSRTELAAENLVFTNAAQPKTGVQSRWTRAPVAVLEYARHDQQTREAGHVLCGRAQYASPPLRLPWSDSRRDVLRYWGPHSR